MTGGSGILCSGFAKALAQCGAKVAVVSRRAESADRVARDIQENGGEALAVTANVLDKQSLEQAKQLINRTFGRCNILINGAGGNHPMGTTDKEYLYKKDLNTKELTTFFDLEIEGVRSVLDLNFLGTLLTTQVFAKDMADHDGNVIVNISSMNAYTPLTKIPAYSGAKAAVSNFTQWLAVHMSKVGIRVNAIAPGFFLTAQNRSLLLNEDGTYTERAQKIINQTPLDRFGVPEDLIGTLLWLVSDKASRFVTGTIIPVDGGFSAYSGV
ncbi:putative oxidoreductase UxuB [Bacillus licheniformis]|nr:D-mannonate oxidoreductase [Bacillus licheniformis]TWJ98347.1 putative oxidoreductase UxuB [Bacillus licheniformis]TWK17705.1 putative oxidoreductase UxuB [Bacillus licheniformis]TWK58502.1 putative oxidoreductase UxuB [Bacillus licheniformis]TWL26617.1 putative oxidoreductase UxuB [Bacillus licheniformis]